MVRGYVWVWRNKRDFGAKKRDLGANNASLAQQKRGVDGTKRDVGANDNSFGEQKHILRPYGGAADPRGI